MKSFIASVLLGAAMACSAVGALAGPQPPQAAAFSAVPLPHARWLARDGAPRNIEGIAQTPDGWLWLGSTDGLYRFDGVEFTRYTPPPGVKISTNIHHLGTLPDGTLWVAPFFGGLYLIKGQELTIFDDQAGFSTGAVDRVVAGPDGRLWLAKESGLYVLEPRSRRWRLVNEELGLSSGAFDVLVGRDGTLWVQTSTGNYALRRGESRFKLIAAQSDPGSLAQGPDGVVWAVNGEKPGLLRLTPGVTPRALADMHKRMVSTTGIHIDSQGGFWFPGAEGLVRVSMAGEQAQAHEFTTRHGLSGKTPIAAFQDREGSIWISTEGGLDQFRQSRMREIALPPKLADARPLAVSDSGELWIDHLYLRDVYAKPLDFSGDRTRETSVAQIYRDPQGTIMYGTYSRLWKLDRLTPVQVPLPPEIEALQLQVIYAIARDAENGLWISLGRRGCWRMKDGVWTQYGGIEALKLYTTTAIVAGPDGRVWFASVANGMAVLQHGQLRKFGPGDGLDIGTVQTILPDASGAWLGGEEGVARFDGRRALRIQGEGGEQFQGGTALVPEPDGGLWLNTARGLVHIAGDELHKAVANPAYRVRYRRYDENDGLLGAPAVLYPSPSMVRTPDGHLVISTTGGVFHFDPARAVGNHVVPPVHVTAIAAGASTYPATGLVRLPAAPENVRIDYTALSLAVPHRVRFQYMLEGVDRSWQEAGARRAAFYTQLAPGNYTFRVKAANDDGVWNEEGARLQFEIPPTFTQTWWFIALLVVTGVALLAVAYRLRIRQITRRVAERTSAQMDERERIARTLHDSFLQNIYGLLLQVESAVMRLPKGEPARDILERALDAGDKAMEEGRHQVRGLRQELPPDADMLTVLRETAAELAPSDCVVVVDGNAPALEIEIASQVFAIAREAMCNALRHSGAGRIEVIFYDEANGLRLTISDNGKGMGDGEPESPPGHFGLQGMRERAEGIGGELDIKSGSHGTTVTLRVKRPATKKHHHR